MLARLSTTLRVFGRDRNANVAMLFGVSLPLLMVAVSVGIDFTRGVMVHQRMNAALDAAALAVGNATSKPSSCSSSGDAASKTACASLQQLAQSYFDQNYDSSKNASYGTPTPVAITIANSSVTLSSSLPLQLTVFGTTALHVATPDVAASSTVVWGQTKLWVALALDNSGSMSQGDSTSTKMAALKDALTNDSDTTPGLLKILGAASGNPGDVQVGMVPFTRSVNPGLAATSPYLDWGEWEAPPANAGTIAATVGPGSACPWPSSGSGYLGYRCTTGSANGSSNTSTIPSSGNICPSKDDGSKNGTHNDRYYNGCYNSIANQTKTVTKTDTTPVTDSQNCTRVGNGTASCSSRSGYPSDGTTSSNTTTVVTNGYSGDSTNTSTNNSPSNTSDATQSCTTSRGVTTCTWRRTVTYTRTTQTITKTAGGYSHAWVVNAHSTWSGCVMDRQQKGYQTSINGGNRTPAAASDYDESNTQPKNSTTQWDDTQFPVENPASCLTAAAVPIHQDWSTQAPWNNLKAKVAAMSANGSTNQAIGVAHGWQMLTTGAPYGTGDLPGGTTKILILFSDGLNTQNRWVGDGSTEGTSDDALIDARMKATCTAAKKDGVVIYAIFVHIGTNGSSTALSNCATDSTKYYDLTSTSAIKTAFSDIAQKITNLRVSQ